MIHIYIYIYSIYTYSYLYSRTYIHTTTHRFFSTVLDQALLDLVLVTFQVLAFNEVLNPCIASVLITAMAQYPWHLLGFHSQIAGIYGMFMQIWNDVYNVFTAQMKYFKSFYRFWPIPILRINLWPTDFHIIPMTEDDSALFQVFRYIVGYNRCNNYLENLVCIYITFCNCKWWVSHHQSDHCLSWLPTGRPALLHQLGVWLKESQLRQDLPAGLHQFGCQIHQRLWGQHSCAGSQTFMTLAWSQIWIDMVLSSENGLLTNNSDKNGKKKNNAPQFPLPLPIHPRRHRCSMARWAI